MTLLEALVVGHIALTIGLAVWGGRKPRPPYRYPDPLPEIASARLDRVPGTTQEMREPFRHASAYEVVREHQGGHHFLYPTQEGQVSGLEAKRVYDAYVPSLPGEAVVFRMREHGRTLERGRKECTG